MRKLFGLVIVGTSLVVGLPDARADLNCKDVAERAAKTFVSLALEHQHNCENFPAQKISIDSGIGTATYNVAVLCDQTVGHLVQIETTLASNPNSNPSCDLSKVTILR